MAIQPKNDTDIKVDQIDEKTSGAGVLIENVLIKDSMVNGLAASGGSSSAYTLTFSPAFSGYVDGMEFRFLANHTSDGTCTLNVNSLGAKNIVDSEGNNLIAECIQTDAYVVCAYDATNDQFVVPGIRSTPWVAYSPSYGNGTGSLTYTSVTTNVARYKIVGQHCLCYVSASGTISGSGDTVLIDTPLTTQNQHGSAASLGSAWVSDGSIRAGFCLGNSATRFGVQRYDSANIGTGSGRLINANVILELAV